MKTIEGYDRIPYESLAIPETHPDYLASLGSLLGLAPADPQACRVLELGAASGGNLIPMAVHLPGSEFVGVELSAEQARRGQAMVAALGLDNLELRHQDIRDLDETAAPFDYILVHGVYSWVPEPVQEQILRLCRQLLGDRGIAYVSYNILPGWRHRGMLRDMLLFHCRDAVSPEERLERARELLGILHGGLQGDLRPDAEVLRREVAYLRGARPSYLYHEYLEDSNSPVLFSDFMARARRHGLEFLAEAKLHTMFASTLGPAAAAVLAGFEGQVLQEQYMDFLRLRAFRQTLLVPRERRPVLEIDLERLCDFFVYADLTPPESVTLCRVEPQGYRSPEGERFQVEHPLTKVVLAHLARVYPNALPLPAQLTGAAEAVAAAGGAGLAGERDACLAELFNLYVSQAIGLTRRAGGWSNQVPERPRATPLARAQAASGEGHVVGARHRSLGLDPLAARVLRLLDGRRTPERLLGDLVAEIRADAALALTLDASGGRDPSEQLTLANLERLLAVFARAGLLVADESVVGSDGTD